MIGIVIATKSQAIILSAILHAINFDDTRLNHKKACLDSLFELG